jgi:plasmid stability protein
MPTLQVRDLPEDIYVKLNMIAAEENRSIAQQTIVLLRESLGLHKNN